MHLAIGALLLLVLSTTCAAYGPRGPDLRHVNQMRKAVGEKAGIEMPELTWDEGLVAKLKNMSIDCKRIRSGWDFRLFQDTPDANGVKVVGLWNFGIFLIYEPHMAAQYNTTDFTGIHDYITGQLGSYDLDTFELLNPTQKTVGCVPKQCKHNLTQYDVDTMNRTVGAVLDGNEYSFNSICIVGPSGTWSPETLKLMFKAAGEVEAARHGAFGINLDSSAPEPEPSTTTTTAAPVPQTVPQEPVPEPKKTPVDPEAPAGAPDAPAAPEESSSSTCGTFLLALFIVIFYL